MSRAKLVNFIVPVFTPFNQDRSLNLSIIPRYAQFLADKGVTGILVNGTTGEGTSLSISERKIVAEAWKNAVKVTKQHLMIQVGGAPLPNVIELAKHAENIGVDSLLCLPELYFKPTTVHLLIDYLKTVAKEAPKTPLLYYHIPMFSNVTIHMGEFLNAVGSEIPNFVGIKFTSANLEEGLCALQADNKKYKVFLGNDQLICAGCAVGMDSFIATSVNLFPKLAMEIFEEWTKNKDASKAMEKQMKLSKYVTAISKHGNWVETMKTAMNILTEIKVGPIRSPLQPLSQEKREIMIKELMKLIPNVQEI